MTQEIIVYRNPAEKAMCDFWMENPQYILYGIGIAALVIIALVIYGKIAERRRYR